MSDNNVLNVVTMRCGIPLIERDKPSGGQTLTPEQIKNLPSRSIDRLIVSTAGSSSTDGGTISIKGARSNATNYYLDGVRVTGAPPPVQDIEQLSVITGALGSTIAQKETHTRLSEWAYRPERWRFGSGVEGSSGQSPLV